MRVERVVLDTNVLISAALSPLGKPFTCLASLWSVIDVATAELSSDLYGLLQEISVSKAEALRQAQTKMLRSGKFSHPAFWSPFLLIGNWL